MTIQDLQKIGKAFRRAFEEVDLSDAPGFLPHFPEGCCNWATWVVGHYLKFEYGLEPVEIQGTRLGADGSDNHAWLLVNGAVIDLTCGQYKDCSEPIIICENSEWHSQWSVSNIEDIRSISVFDSVLSSAGICASDVYKRLSQYVHAQLA